MSLVTLNGNSLEIDDIVNVARSGYKVALDPSAENAIRENRKELEAMTEIKVVYGVTTGFGNFHDKILPASESAQLSKNIILSHACAVGDPLGIDVVKAAMVIRVNAFAKGVSGVRLELVECLIWMINNDVIPYIPRNGSLASSGDLCLLAHLGLVVIGEDSKVYVRDDGKGDNKLESEKSDSKQPEYKLISTKEAKIPHVSLSSKEGLALTNGSSFTAAIAALSLHDAYNVWKSSNLALALTMEATKAVPNAFDARVHNVRAYEGSLECARHIRMLTRGSDFVDAKNRVQDAYSVRCAPAVHGAAVYNSLEFIKSQIVTEINSATDNPLIFGKDVLSGGNFHGEPLAIALDLLKICLAELGGISERRTARLVDKSLNNGLPDMLVKKSALNSGLMIPQYTAASLVLKNRVLAGPDSVSSLPTACNQEDFNSNGMNSGLHLLEILENLRYVLAIEIFTASRGMFLRQELESKANFGAGTSEFYKVLMKIAPYVAEDYNMNSALVEVKKYISTNEFLELYNSYTKESKDIVLDNPRGMRDIMPDQMIVRRKVLETIKNIFLKHGACEIDTPALERRDILFGKYGEANKLVYDLNTDGQQLSMRYDLTVPFARFLAQHGINKIKRFHCANVWRRDHPSLNKGRYCQFTQFDFDIAGAGELMLQDAEILYIMAEVLSAVEIGPYVVKLSHRKLLSLLTEFCGVPADKFATVCSSIDKLDKESWEKVALELKSKSVEEKVILKLGDYMTINGDCREVEKKLSTLFMDNKEIKQVLGEMNTLFNYLESMKCLDKFSFTLSLARGLDYYTGVIFEAITLDKSIGVGSIAAGGRYDNLVGMFHPQKREIPCVGCSFGIERLFTILEKKQEEKKRTWVETQVLVHPIGKGMISQALEICSELWKSNIKAEFIPIAMPKMKEQIEYCLNNGIKFMVIVGEDEFKKGVVNVKDMSAKTQVVVKRVEVADWLLASLEC